MSVVKINAIEVPQGAGPELEARFAARMGAVEGTAGFEGFELLRPVAGEERYFVYTRWADEGSYRAWADGGARSAHAGTGGSGGADSGAGENRRPVSTGASLLEFEVVTSVGPSA